MRISDWSSDVCSSDLLVRLLAEFLRAQDPTAIYPEAAILDANHRVVAAAQEMHDRIDPRLDRLAGRGGVCAMAVAARLGSRSGVGRSEARRVGKECVSTCRSRWSPYH